MKTEPLTISPPDINGVTPMTPLELNAVRFNIKHTVLTPEILETEDTATRDKIS